MVVTRREFLGCAAGTVGSLGGWSVAIGPSPRWVVLLDLRESCCLRESIAGYESALASMGVPWKLADVGSPFPSRCPALIVPAAVDIPPAGSCAIVSCLQAGATVILESGAGFADVEEFLAHRDVLRDSLQVGVEAPVQLWPTRTRPHGIPYVDYTWPYAAKLRDFSRVVPLVRRGRASEIIGWVDGLPVALRRRIGHGTLIFLGSPLGPALWAGDAEARRWLSAILSTRCGTC